LRVFGKGLIVMVELVVIFHGGIDLFNKSLEQIVGFPWSDAGNGIWDVESKWQESKISTRNKGSQSHMLNFSLHLFIASKQSEDVACGEQGSEDGKEDRRGLSCSGVAAVERVQHDQRNKHFGGRSIGLDDGNAIQIIVIEALIVLGVQKGSFWCIGC
jgi:hypothetical protein